MRTSCRENWNHCQLLGYFRGAREFFPQGTFQETELVVVPDPVWQSSDGVKEAISRIGSIERELDGLRKRKVCLTDSINDQSVWRSSDEIKRLYQQELIALSGKVSELKEELAELCAIIG